MLVIMPKPTYNILEVVGQLHMLHWPYPTR